MKLMKLKSPFWSLFVVALLVGLPCLCSEAQARGGFGGFHGGGGFSGGSFREGGGYAQGPRGGAVAEGSGEVRMPGPPVGARPTEAPLAAGRQEGLWRRGHQRVGGRDCLSGQRLLWGSPHGVSPRQLGGLLWPQIWRGAAGLAVGTVVGTLPAAAAARTIAGRRYYYDGIAYYQPCYEGTDVNYCVVADPNR